MKKIIAVVIVIAWVVWIIGPGVVQAIIAVETQAKVDLQTQLRASRAILTVDIDLPLNPASQNYVKGTENRLFSAFKFSTGSKGRVGKKFSIFNDQFKLSPHFFESIML